MKYMTNQMLQRFMSNMSTTLMVLHKSRQDVEAEIEYCKFGNGSKDELPLWYRAREEDRKLWLKMEYIQGIVKSYHRNNLPLWKSLLQRMEKVVTAWIKAAEWQKYYAHQDYLDNRYDTFYRNKTKQAKQRLAKLVELQQAIRKQKSITKE